jgi:hypothetical protein
MSRGKSFVNVRGEQVVQWSDDVAAERLRHSNKQCKQQRTRHVRTLHLALEAKSCWYFFIAPSLF